MQLSNTAFKSGDNSSTISLNGATAQKGHLYFTGDNAQEGQTLRLVNAPTNTTLQFSNSTFTIGGLITEGNATYTVGRTDNKACNITLKGNNAVNLDIKANTNLSTMANSQTITVATGGEWRVAEGKTLTLAAHSGISLGENVAVNATGTSGAVTFSQALSLGGGSSITNAGTMTMGAVNFNGADAIINNTGSLTITGALTGTEVWALSGDASITYSDTDNGYRGGSVTTKLIDGSATVTADTISINGTAYTLDKTADGVSVTYTIDAADKHYCVNTEVVYGAEGNSAAAAETTGIIINGGNLVLNSSFTKEGAGFITSEKAGTITLNTPTPAEGEAAVPTVLNKSSVAAVATVSLAGNGVYDLGNSLTLGDNVALGDNWTGTVRFNGMNFANGANTNRFGYINDLGNSNSWVEMSSCSGYLYSTTSGGSVTATVNIIMAGETALAVNNGNSDGVATFDGDITGTGALTLTLTGSSGPQGVGFEFNGNTSGWTGNIVTNTKNGNTLRVSKVAFNGTSAVSNKEIKSAAGLVELTIGGNSTEANGTTPAITTKNIDSKIYGDGSIALVTTGTIAKVFTKTVEVADVSCTYTNNGANKTVAHSALELSGGAVTFKENVTVHGDAKINTAVTANKGMTIDAGKAITVGSTAGNSLTHDGVIYSNGAVITNSGTSAAGVSVWNKDFSITGGSVEIAGSAIAPVGARDVNAIFDGTAVTFTGTANFNLSGTQQMASLAATKDTATLQISGDSTIGSVTGFKSITIDKGKSLKSDALTIDTKLALSSTGALTVTGTLAFGENAKLDLTGLTVDGAGEYVLATAGTLTGVPVSVTGLDNIVDTTKFEWVLTAGGTQVASSTGAAGASLMAADNTLTLTVTAVTPAEAPYVSAVAWADDALKLTIAGDIPANGALAVVVSGAMWETMMATVTANGGSVSGEGVAFSLVDAGGTAIDMSSYTAVTFNGYAGEGGNKYAVIFIPEPATATLGLLALAGLAARRRRKH